MKGGLLLDRIIGFDLQMLAQVGFLALNVLILFGVLAKILFKPVRQYMQNRREGIRSDLEQAKSEREKAKNLRAEYEKKLDGIQQEADEILRDAHKNALAKENDMIAKAKEEAQRIYDRAKLEIEREQDKAKDDLKKEIVELASIMASKFVVSTIDEDTQNQLIEKTIQEMGDHSWLN